MLGANFFLNSVRSAVLIDSITARYPFMVAFGMEMYATICSGVENCAVHCVNTLVALFRCTYPIAIFAGSNPVIEAIYARSIATSVSLYG